ncbi:golgi reassembly-stacking protein 2-like [Lichtheimia corymbifera JMRC:FSU:9682]|uniref:Golgi reassembly-stacking protein 2-like n=1 Tax=Lichtheimia corymbifera JMRC:FSU:9682 TaxID=1263082 RepID=A0A068RMQ6_9FUNG|nr:golgi reassembly-stacking protein 2-like [Lichtheimia corymbifera JMRC:FSU:9682]
MGGTQSTEQGQYGFHVLKVKENSPAFKAGIEQFFDYIIGINGIKVDNGDSETLLRILNDSENKPVQLEVYSSKEQAVREVTLVPSSDWHKDNPGEKSLIGCSIRFCSYERAGEHVWHVLSVAPNSPAEMAGIIPESDYIIGSPHAVLASEDGFYDLVEEHIGKPLQLYLYNSEWDSCREVIIVPNHDWGGHGSLGCDVGYGLLHRIPRKSVNTRPSEDVSAQYSNAIFNAPADEPQEQPSSSSLPPHDEATAPSSQEEPSSSNAEQQQQQQQQTQEELPSSSAKDEQLPPSPKEAKPSSPKKDN